MSQSFPDDENGNTLRRMQDNGDDLSRLRDLDFSIVFPNESSVIDFIDIVKGDFDRISYYRIDDDGEDEFPWDVTATILMVPTYQQISDTEAFLRDLAGKFGGKIDGWGCFAVKADQK